MAPYKNLKTYQRKDRNVTSSSSKSVEVINDLFAKNISKRIATKKSPVKIEELPPRTESYAQTSDSIQVSAEDTFDKLLAGPKYNAVKITDSFKKIPTTSESDASIANVKSIHVSRQVHKPIIKRRRRKPKCTVVEVEGSPEKSSPSPPLTPLVIDTVCSELSVEPVQKPDFAQDSLEESKDHDMVFTESFRQKLKQQSSILSSTPIVHAARKNIITNAISPIEKNNLFEKSYDEIKKWDSNFPQIEPLKPLIGDIISKPLKNVTKRRKSKCGTKFSDWKLNCEPKVFLDPLKQTKVVEKAAELKKNTDCQLKVFLSPLKQTKVVEKVTEVENTTDCQPKVYLRPLKPSLQQTKVIENVEEDEDNTEHSYALLPGADSVVVPVEHETPHIPIQVKVESDSDDGLEIEESIISLDNSWMEQETRTEFLKKNITKRRQRKQSFDLVEAKLDMVEENFELVDEKVEIETVPVYGREDLSETSASEQRTPEKQTNPRVEQRTRQFMNIFHDHSYSASPVVGKPSSKEAAKSKPEKVKSKAKQTKGKSNEKTKGKPEKIVESPAVIALPSMFEPSGADDVLDLDEFEDCARKALEVKPGKKYRRSLAQEVAKIRCTGLAGCVCLNCARKQNRIGLHPRRTTVRIVPAPTNNVDPDLARRSVLQLYAQGYAIKEEPDRTADLEDSVRSLSLINSSESCILVNETAPYDPESLSARDIILSRCGQREPLPFDECYPSSLLQNCHKIGEGVYGEVFLYRNPKGGTTVMKVIPIEGSQIINGEQQKKFSDILSEVVITMELSDLRKTGRNTTSCFCEVQKIRCVQGRYPDRLIDLWDIYDENRGSENDSPLTFNSQQLYIILELTNGGSDLEAFNFNNALQAYSMFRQLATALAVAENQLKFEHRDLHWGNVLINDVDKNKVIDFCLNGEDVQFISYGVEVCVIDFTLSRIEHDGVVIYLDLSQDRELFLAKGDYQFEIYRIMQENNENEWQHFEPSSNVLWLHYILDKCVGHLRYKNTKSKTHKDFLEKLKLLKDTILKHRSAQSFVTETLMRKK